MAHNAWSFPRPWPFIVISTCCIPYRMNEWRNYLTCWYQSRIFFVHKWVCEVPDSWKAPVVLLESQSLKTITDSYVMYLLMCLGSSFREVGLHFPIECLRWVWRVLLAKFAKIMLGEQFFIQSLNLLNRFTKF